jgi:hypothetical protein
MRDEAFFQSHSINPGGDGGFSIPSANSVVIRPVRIHGKHVD